MTEHIVAVFHNAAEADAAERDLQSAGIAAAALRRYSGPGNQAASATGVSRVESAQPTGFWAWLLGEETPSGVAGPDYRADGSSFDRRASAGETVLSVTLTDDSQIHRTIEVLEAHNPVGIDESTEEDEGEAVTSTRSSAEPSTVQGQEEVIPLAKEEVDIGKRQVDRGTTRVRRYVVETPVERDVQLRGERVTV